MKKYLILFLTLMLIILSFASCDDEKKSSKGNKTEKTNQSTGVSTEDSGNTDTGADTTESSETNTSADTTESGETDTSTDTTESSETDTSAKDEEDVVTIIFNLDGGTILSGEMYAQITQSGKLSTKDFPVVMKEGYVLVGWKNGTTGEMWEKEHTFDKYTTLYAVWEKEGGEDDVTKPDGSFTKYDYDMTTLITLPPILSHEFEIDEDSVKQAIGTYLMQYASPSSETTCEVGKVVLCAYVGYYIDENGNIVVENGKEKTFDKSDNSSFYIGSNLAIKDLEQGLIGMYVGQEKDIYATFPTDYEPDPTLAGKKVLFRVKLKSIYEPPVYNDAFVQKYFSTLKTTKDFEDALLKEYTLTLVYDYISNYSQVIEYPEAEYAAAQDQLEEISETWVQNYGMTLDSYILSTYGMTRDEYIKSNMKTEMIFYYLRQVFGESVNPSVDELLAERESLIEEYKNQYITSNGMSEEEALASATEFVDALGGDYIFEQVMYEKIDDIIPTLVITKVIESELEYCWENK